MGNYINFSEKASKLYKDAEKEAVYQTLTL